MGRLLPLTSLAVLGLMGAGGMMAARGQVPPAPAKSPAPAKAAVDPAAAKKPIKRPPPAAASTAPAKAAPAQGTSLANLPLVPAPTPVPAEVQHNAALDRLLAPVLAVAPAPADAAALQAAINAVNAGNGALAMAQRDQMQDPLARKIVDWQIVRSDRLDVRAADIEAFRLASPDWPDQAALRQRAEEVLLVSGAPAAEVMAFFKSQPPQSGAGHAALGAALIAGGDAAQGRAAIARAWREHDLSSKAEEAVRTRLAAHLTAADHKFRLDRLLLADLRWTDQRNARANEAARLIPLLPSEAQAAARARLAAYLRSGTPAQQLARLPVQAEGAAPDWGLAYARIQHLRRADRHKEAWQLLLAAPTDAARVVSPDDWWVERRHNAYNALKAGDAETAYRISAGAGPLSVNMLRDQTFLAGWLALRHLNQPKVAEKHFAGMVKAADGPLGAAKAHYWHGRALEALGDRARATEQYRKATVYFDTFYGQLARQTLEPANKALRIAPPPQPTADDAARFAAREPVRALMLVKRAGLDQLARPLIRHLGFSANASAPHIVLTAHLAVALGDTQMAVRIGKHGLARGVNMTYYAYPVSGLPAYRALRPSPETAVILGIARQESEFNTLTLSGAGAKGILQVMTVTAKHVCRDYKIRCDIPRLMQDASYNTTMGAAYIGDRMADFSGSYVLTLPGYNAGPGRTRQWIREFGDPRDPKLDPLDWIVRIPIEETREYVKKVLSNVQVYRARLGDEANAMRIGEDLVRARGVTALPAAPAEPAPEPEAGTGLRTGTLPAQDQMRNSVDN